ncbi:MAG: alanine:cation symporter family protein [Oscillospiraceae bacterium]|jgi:AGCS family alanine or glycine:cation symporter|nr:alanine:cation symporter family protein [Oscillospiraceae bacterium]
MRTDNIPTLLERITELNAAVYGFVWGPVMLAFFMFVGVMFTVRSGFFQFTHFKLWITQTALSIFKKRVVRKTKDAHAISQFQSLCTALAATIGTGNIVGVATALALGGPGAIFWMWISACLGMMTAFAEVSLGVKYRYRSESGSWIGGAMIYIERGLKCKPLAVIYSVFLVLASFGMGNMSQANSVAAGLSGSFGISPVITAIALMVLISLVILGGIKRIAGVTEKIVPFMAAFYFIGGLIVVFAHIGNVGSAFELIFREAFRADAAAGGIAGYGMFIAMRRGISRGVFTNEAGLGSGVIAHSASDVTEPAIQGMWGILEVFIDTILICTLTAIAILCSGVYDLRSYAAALRLGELPETMTGVGLVNAAFDTALPFGGYFISVSIALFAFATLVGWSYYGERGITYLLGQKAVLPYKLIFIAAIAPGCVSNLNLVWDVSDTFNGLMAIPNLIALTLLSGQVIAGLRGYLSKKP